jgi:colicin import membrane protein
MKRLWLGLSAVLVALAVVSAPQLFSQEKAKPAAEPAKKEAKGPARRLPNNFGKLGLSDEQKEKVYAVQAKYAGEIAQLQKQLADARAKIKTESEALLTADQKAKLAEILAEAKKKADEEKKAEEAKKAAAAKPAADAPKAEAKPASK